MKLWWTIVGFVAGYGFIGGITSGAPASDYAWFVGGILMLGLVGTGAINSYRQARKSAGGESNPDK